MGSPFTSQWRLEEGGDGEGRGRNGSKWRRVGEGEGRKQPSRKAEPTGVRLRGAWPLNGLRDIASSSFLTCCWERHSPRPPGQALMSFRYYQQGAAAGRLRGPGSQPARPQVRGGGRGSQPRRGAPHPSDEKQAELPPPLSEAIVLGHHSEHGRKVWFFFLPWSE